MVFISNLIVAFAFVAPAVLAIPIPDPSGISFNNGGIGLTRGSKRDSSGISFNNGGIGLQKHHKRDPSGISFNNGGIGLQTHHKREPEADPSGISFNNGGIGLQKHHKREAGFTTLPITARDEADIEAREATAEAEVAFDPLGIAPREPDALAGPFIVDGGRSYIPEHGSGEAIAEPL